MISKTDSPLISICIPTYEAKGKGVELLTPNIASCLNQTYKNIEIIISDHSVNDDIKDFCNNIKDSRIKYIRYKEHRGKPAYNTNNAIYNSIGDYIKVMNQDDFFLKKDSLELAIKLLNDNSWVIFPCAHINSSTLEILSYHNPYLPINKENLIQGINTIGTPSCGLFPRGFEIDVNISYMIDCELWYNLYVTLGPAAIVNEYCIGILLGDHQLTHQLKDQYDEMMKHDIEYCFDKYKIIK
jgi:glycosyltransferase involved in cell wall biosynthesis